MDVLSQSQAPAVRDPDAEFAAFFDAAYAGLVRSLFVVTGNKLEAEDLVQEAMARAYERWRRVSTMSSREGYVYRVAVNLNRKRLHRLRRHLQAITLASANAGEPLETATRTALLQAVTRLPENQRVALVLTEFWGLPSHEVAGILGVKAASVRSRVHRARSSLRASLGGDDG